MPQSQDCFKSNIVQQEAASRVCPDTHLTPLHLAVKSGKLNLVQTVLSCNPKLDLRDKNGSNVLHFAASTSKEIISLICSAILSSTPGSTNSITSSANDSINTSGTTSATNPTPVKDQQKASSPVRDDTLLLRLINERNKDNVSPIHLVRYRKTMFLSLIVVSLSHCRPASQTSRIV